MKLLGAVNDTYAPILLLPQFEEVMKFSLSPSSEHKEESLFFLKEQKGPDFTPNAHPDFRQRDYR